MRCFLLLIALALASGAQAQITTSPEVIVRGEPVTVTFAEPTDSLLVTYRPNSGIAYKEVVPASGTSATWTPNRAGVVALATPAGASQNVSVRFDRTPVSGILILTLAGIVLFGGAAFAMRALLSEDTPTNLPLDT
ncbi:hypothetical protein [Rubricoccus marinus]|uniref:Uncharacterized protein n=1 Tax=Rubricoccus marinus TaxID=716817 RepID=A0A259TYC7_9BACT|nr:hypothetical protein [Rubricoccus marinus]OZC02696.1 hypothetical protein BSZ36_06735 [Rubricoccus marinus]